ncbi:thiopeptide-type bacteriocin biosynthesis protein [Bacillus thuringiensis]|uniref:thiopeptide-type bacteriocin biosynthesis protein n=1 Tax=Bacillus thuringiensis TaxID=1428 RepID=UPI000BF793AF|nr:thiopeptide-type bacteriocin biosynthesis protein [Bacillus thuringiensis]PFN36589.1 hypothetical protein COJ56_23490 [Bacillus thuringiensis]
MWSSYHIFCHHKSVHEEIIHKIYRFMMEYKQKKWFFIRYWEGGPHIRFRVKNIENESLFFQKLSSILSDLLMEESSLTKEEYYRGNKLDGEYISIEKLSWYANNTIQKIAYEPEIERYGGHRWIGEAEMIFNKSSIMASELISEYKGLSYRLYIFLGMYLRIFNILRKKINEFDVHMYSKTCSDYWENKYGIKNIGYFQDVSRRLENSYVNNRVEFDYLMEKSLSISSCQIYINQLTKIIGDISNYTGEKVGRSVLFSQMHMTANRMGIPIEYEYSIYRMLGVI